MKKLSRYSKVMLAIGVILMVAGVLSIVADAGNLSALFFTLSFVSIYANLMAPDEERYVYVKKKNTYVEP